MIRCDRCWETFPENEIKLSLYRDNPRCIKCFDAPRLTTPLTDYERKDRADARRIFSQAVRKGELTKASKCENPECVSEKVEGHHPNYSKPLDVRWLCSYHHRYIHV